MEPKKTPTQKHFCHILNFQDLHVHIDQGFGFTSMLSECTGKRLGTKTPQLLILLTLAIRPKLYCEVSPPMPTMQENGLEIEKKCAKKNKLSLDTLKAAFIFSTWMWMWVKKAHWKLPGLFLFQVIRCSRVGEWPKSPKDSLKSVSTPFFWEATNLQEFRRSFQPLTFHFPIKPAATPNQPTNQPHQPTPPSPTPPKTCRDAILLLQFSLMLLMCQLHPWNHLFKVPHVRTVMPRGGAPRTGSLGSNELRIESAFLPRVSRWIFAVKNSKITWKQGHTRRPFWGFVQHWNNVLSMSGCFKFVASCGWMKIKKRIASVGLGSDFFGI